MRKLFFGLLLFIAYSTSMAQKKALDTQQLRQDFEKLMSDLERNYVYYKKKKVDLRLFKEYYAEKLLDTNTQKEPLLFFEFMLLEFYDSHMHLKSNNNKSYRLFSPVYASIVNDKITITDYWKDQIKNRIEIEIIGSEILAFNNEDIESVVEKFPTHCHDKNDPEIRTWIINKILSGRYHEKRVLKLKLQNGEIVNFDLDTVKLRKDEGILSLRIVDNVGIIRLNNSLDNTSIRFAINNALNEMKNVDGIIIDIRNSVDGGNTKAAYPIIEHFIKKPIPFQKYQSLNGKQETDKLNPTKPFIDKPMILVVGRWTGSVGEGLASGVQSNKIGIVLGTEMHKLAGAMCDYKFKHSSYGYQIPCIDVQQLNGKSRTAIVPDITINNDNGMDDLFIKEAVKTLKNNSKKT